MKRTPLAIVLLLLATAAGAHARPPATPEIFGAGNGSLFQLQPASLVPGSAPVWNGSAWVLRDMDVADNLTAGTLPDGRFPAVLPAVSGANLTALNASALATGTVGRPLSLSVTGGGQVSISAAVPFRVTDNADNTVFSVSTSGAVSGVGSGLTGLPAANLTGTLPAISGINLTNLTAANLTGNLPAISGANLTGLTAANLTGPLPAISGASLTALPASTTLSDTSSLARLGAAQTFTNTNTFSSTATFSAGTTTGYFYDATASTGATLVGIRAGAGDASNGRDIFNVYANNGTTKLFQVTFASNSSGRVTSTVGGEFLSLKVGSAQGAWDANGLNMPGTTGKVTFTSTGSTGTADTGLARNAAGIIEANSGTAGTFRDLKSRHLLGAGTPSIAAGTGAGTTPTLTVGGTDTAGVATITTGTTPAASAVVGTVTFSAAYPNNSYVVLTPANANAAALSGGAAVYVQCAAGTFTVNVGASGLAASTAYVWTFHAAGN